MKASNIVLLCSRTFLNFLFSKPVLISNEAILILQAKKTGMLVVVWLSNTGPLNFIVYTRLAVWLARTNRFLLLY